MSGEFPECGNVWNKMPSVRGARGRSAVDGMTVNMSLKTTLVTTWCRSCVFTGDNAAAVKLRGRQRIMLPHRIYTQEDKATPRPIFAAE